MLAYYSGTIAEAEEGWRNLTEIVDRSKGLGSFSVEHLFDLAQELGDVIDSPAFDVFYEKVAVPWGATLVRVKQAQPISDAPTKK